MAVLIRATLADREAIAARCLLALPEWFGRPDATARYIAEAGTLPMFAAFDDGTAVGFLSLKDIGRTDAEIHVIGVLRTHHRRGIGRGLVEAAAANCRRRGLTVLKVQTVGESHPDANYALTRLFYRAVGFRPVREELDGWGPGMPRMTLAVALNSAPSPAV